MRGRDQTYDGGADDERIINPDADATEYLKAAIDARWRRYDPNAESNGE